MRRDRYRLALTHDAEAGVFRLVQPQPPSRTSGPSKSRARSGTAPRGWLPLLVSWDPLRNRQVVECRLLTVAENSRPCSASTAFAARVSWGRFRDESVLVYRSLGPPALRSFLGHQTRARFLVALFDRSGKVTPVLTVE